MAKLGMIMTSRHTWRMGDPRTWSHVLRTNHGDRWMLSPKDRVGVGPLQKMAVSFMAEINRAYRSLFLSGLILQVVSKVGPKKTLD